MEKSEAVLKLLLEALQANLTPTEVKADTKEIPLEVSNRHVHLSQKDLDSLFGEGYQLTKIKDLSQPGQHACKEILTICGPNGAIEKVRIIGPVRSKTQVEILEGDCYKLGVTAQARLSGELQGTRGITIIGPKGSVQTTEGLIVAQRHLHMTSEDAKRFDVHDGQIVSIQIDGLRGGIYNNVAIRANNESALACHIDTEEANAMKVNSLSKIKIIK
jgi:putative phosphotransacetylase